MYRSLVGHIVSCKCQLQKAEASSNENINEIQGKLNSSKRQENLEMSRSVSLSDLIAAANELIVKEKKVNQKVKKSNLKVDSKKKEYPTIATALASISVSTDSSSMLSPPIYSKDLNAKISSEIKERIEIYRNKTIANERLEIDIEPSVIRIVNNKLLIASSDAQIRVFDLQTSRVEKDELKNVFVSSICMPFNKHEDVLFALTNGEVVDPEKDEYSLSNSIIIVTKKELKVLKKDSKLTLNDDYNFNNPCGIVYDKFNNLYVCDCNYNRVKILDQNFILTETIETASNANDRLNQPKSLCISHEKSLLFVCDSGNHRIVAYDILKFGKEFSFKNIYGYGYGEELGKMRFPLDCSVDSSGFLIIRDHHNSRLQVFGPNTMLIHKIDFNDDNETICSLTCGEHGDIYAGKKIKVSQEKAGLGEISKYFIDIY